MYDLIIIGLGPAGINAGIYAKRSKLNVLLIEKETPGGKLNSINKIDNYLGAIDLTGPELATTFYKQIRALKPEIKLEEVIDIKEKDDFKEVITNKATYCSKTVIISSGSGQKKLQGFESIQNISYCALCDANLYENKDVVLIGNNFKAIEEAKYLSKIVNKLYFIYEGKKIDLKLDNVEIIYDEVVKDIKIENNLIKEVILKNSNLIVSGIFVSLGSGPSSSFAENLGITDEKGFITVNENQETTIPGIYACGDIVKKAVYQIINAASEGAIGAINAGKYIRNKSR
ncbi:MAG: FAD-dependent oxidoreductase [Bacilli bacterium]|nr:FAD-dependent oxidoreductase [Bacilli bacterium]